MSELELELTFDEIISKKGLEYYFQDEKYKNIEILRIGIDSNQQINILNLDILLSLKNLKELFIYDCIEVTSTNNLENIKVLHIHDGFKCKKLSYLKCKFAFHFTATENRFCTVKLIHPSK